MAKKDIRPRYRFPEQGRDAKVLNEALREAGDRDASWKDGKTFSLVFYAGEEVSEVTRNAYEAYRYENGLNPTAFPSLRKFENEVVSLTIDLMHGDDDVVGNMTSGGTESILCAVKAAHSWAKATKPNITAPEMVVPISVHPAFDKAAYYFGVKVVHVAVDPESMRADTKAMEAAINANTIMIVGSAPAYPHGVVDPIEELAALALKNNLWMHVDACVGGYILPWVERLGYPIPNFDYRVAGVVSMSMDLHKYGYSAKGGSCVLYKNSEMRKYQYFVYTGWTGGIYASPSVAGTRPGGAIAAAWAVLNYLGAEGYMRLAKDVMDATLKVRNAVEAIEGIHIIGNPHMCVVAIGSDKLPIFNIGDELSAKGYHIDRQQNPDSLHLTISWGNVKAIDQFIIDLQEAVAIGSKFSLHNLQSQFTVGLVKTASKVLSEEKMTKFTNFLAKMGGGDGPPKRTAAMYGMMGALPNKGDLDELILDMLDGLNKPEKV
jgi:glutamate/tyrosine decarboxylase-like PLP-dependent enzyme